MKRSSALPVLVAIVLATLAVVPVWAAEAKPILITMLDSYTRPDKSITLAVIANFDDELLDAELELFYAPAKLALVNVRGRAGVRSSFHEENSRMVVHFSAVKGRIRSGLQVVGYLEFFNLQDNEYAEVLLTRASVNGTDAAPGAARVHSKPQTQMFFLPEGEVMVPVWGRQAQVVFDPERVDYLGDLSGSVPPQRSKRLRGATDRIVISHGEDDVTLLFFKMRNTDARTANDPLGLEVIRPQQ